MYDEDLIKRIISKSKHNELKWIRRSYSSGKMFICKNKIDGNKHLLLKVFMGDDIYNSYLDIYMTGNVFVHKIEIMDCSELYNLLFVLDLTF